MTLNDFRGPSAAHPATLKLNEIQADLVSTARMWAADEVGAVMAHQIYEPLTALLLYMHELKRRVAESEAGSLSQSGEMIDKALREAERVCEIMESVGRNHVGPASNNDTDAALARGTEAIEWVNRNGDAAHRNGYAAKAATHARPSSAGSGMKSLTPREREVISLITAGTSNKEGGFRLGISMRTFEVHRAHIMAKLGARNAADLVRIALSEDR